MSCGIINFIPRLGDLFAGSGLVGFCSSSGPNQTYRADPEADQWEDFLASNRKFHARCNQQDDRLSEFSGTRIPFEEFVKRPAWKTLPFLIRLAVLHLRRAEEQPMPEREVEETPPKSPPRLHAMEDHHPA